MNSYEEKKDKADRELLRLKQAEDSLDENNAKDHAMNAAYSIYSLLDWKQKSKNQASATKICKETSLLELIILHHIVTYDKHAESSYIKSYQDTRIHVKKDLDCIETEDGDPIIDATNQHLYTENSYLKILFRDREASDVLNICYNSILTESYLK